MPQRSALFLVHQNESPDRFTAINITSSRHCAESCFHFSSQHDFFFWTRGITDRDPKKDTQLLELAETTKQTVVFFACFCRFFLSNLLLLFFENFGRISDNS